MQPHDNEETWINWTFNDNDPFAMRKFDRMSYK